MKRRSLYALVLCMALVAMSPASAPAAPRKPAPQASAQVLVVVSATDAGTGELISGAQVTVSARAKDGTWQPAGSGVTNASGTWTFSGRLGTYRFAVSAASADGLSVDRTYTLKGEYSLPVALTCYGALSGRVVDVAGAPLSGARVELYRAAAGGWETVPSMTVEAPDGAFTTSSLVTGSYALRGSAPGYVSAFIGGEVPTAFSISRGEALSGVDVALQPSEPAPPLVGTISGTIFGGGGAWGLAGTVYFYKQNDDLSWPSDYVAMVWTASDGTYTSPDLELGTYRVKLFSWHTGAQYWRYVSSADSATPVVLAGDGQSVSGVDAIFPLPAP